MITTPATIQKFKCVTGGYGGNTHKVANLDLCQIVSYLTQVIKIPSVCQDHGTAY